MTNNVSVNPETCTIEVDTLGGAKIVVVIEGIITSIILPSILIAIGLIVDLISSTLGGIDF